MAAPASSVAISATMLGGISATLWHRFHRVDQTLANWSTLTCSPNRAAASSTAFHGGVAGGGSQGPIHGGCLILTASSRTLSYEPTNFGVLATKSVSELSSTAYRSGHGDRSTWRRWCLPTLRLRACLRPGYLGADDLLGASHTSPRSGPSNVHHAGAGSPRAPA